MVRTVFGVLAFAAVACRIPEKVPLATDAADDADGDGLPNGDEYAEQTDPHLADTDGDTLPDGWEVDHNLDPLDATGDILSKFLRRLTRSNLLSSRQEADLETLQGQMPRGAFTELPVHFYILTFHLDLHHYVWVHVDDMAPYVYQPALKTKLVLPPQQTDLIDILTAEMDVLMDDIVEGKSGGTTVLCAFGCGAELTVETATLDRYPIGGHDGGTYRKDNVRAACGSCNSRHGSLDMHVRLGHNIRSVVIGDPVVTIDGESFTGSLPYLVELDS